MVSFGSFTGQITGISSVEQGDVPEGCLQMIHLQNQEGTQTNFILSPDTYVLNQEMMSAGDIVTGYYDANAPAILIYPPQYPALVMVKEHPDFHVKVSHFNNRLVSADNRLALHLDPYTRVLTPNGQSFIGNPGDRDLVVIYGASTKSIPAQTTPYQVTVLCQ